MTPPSTGGSRVRMGPGGEFDVIRAILAESDEPGPDVVIGPGDDALVLAGGWILSCDLSVEDVHFRTEWMELREVGYRAAAAALSDLAAMAAEARGVLTSIAAFPDDGEGVREIAAGAREAAQSVGGALLGGDLASSSGTLVVDVVAVGRAERPVSRAGAVPGDTLWVTGSLGGAAGAVRVWKDGGDPSSSLRNAFVRPSPRIAEARWLVETGRVDALVDVSDGVAGDAGHLAAAGGVRIVLEADALPVHPDLPGMMGDEGAARELALYGGEDYELLFAGPEESIGRLADPFFERFGVALTPIGRVEAGEGVFLVPEGGGAGDPEALERGGYNHFPPISDGSEGEAGS